MAAPLPGQQLSAQGLALRDRGGQVLDLDPDEIGLQQVGGQPVLVRPDGSYTEQDAGIAGSDIQGVEQIEARRFLGDSFMIHRFPFSNPTWVDPYVAAGASPPIMVNGPYDGGRLDLATGGSNTGSAFGRVLGTKVPTGTPNWSTIASGGATMTFVENLRTSPWYLSTWCQLNSHSDTPGAQQKIPLGMTWVNSDPRVTAGHIALVYTGSQSSLRIRCDVNGSTAQEQDLSWGPGTNQETIFHRFSLGFDGTQLVCLIDGVQQGISFSGLINIPTSNNAGWPIFGLHCGGVAANFQCEWGGYLTVGTRIARGR